MKLGNGSKKYKFKFIYLDTGRTSIKNVYAEDIEEAKELFLKEYEGFKIQVLRIETPEYVIGIDYGGEYERNKI